MNEVFINIKKEDECVRKYFTRDFISISELIGLIIDLDYEKELLKEQLEDACMSDNERYENWKWNKADEVVDEMLMKEKE